MMSDKSRFGPLCCLLHTQKKPRALEGETSVIKIDETLIHTARYLDDPILMDRVMEHNEYG